MNILYISQMNSVGWAGPNYSVPKQVLAQSKYDNVFWYHLRSEIKDDWREQYDIKSINEYPELKICQLPKPFNRPDLIVIEQFYGYGDRLSIIREIINSKIPYVIVPRGEFTKMAQQRKKIKKLIGNFIFFRKFAKNAIAIQYLTEKEKKESGKKWNERSFVIPNGVDKKTIIKKKFNYDKIICVSIGRIEKYQKGLDFLIEVCRILKSELLNKNFELHLYGPDQENQKDELKKNIKENGLESIIYMHDPVFGKEKEKILLEADIFIMTSRFEGHPMALIEALSYGLPCFVTQGTNMKEEILNFNAGWGAENNIESISKNMLKMLDEITELKEKQKGSLKLANEYDWNIIGRFSHGIYEEILKKDNKRYSMR
ncbi:glycosyltransferase [Clostridium perfringens]|uniref:glycosyltransferase n=1 Tax=Clostridium perfringens TaxID=1502 RepID=UPI0013E2C41B|nr:glycosyltransferase [Clostridium perfringens]NGU52990.1 glycosyltransferase [Clostridium perfringens]